MHVDVYGGRSAAGKVNMSEHKTTNLATFSGADGPTPRTVKMYTVLESWIFLTLLRI